MRIAGRILAFPGVLATLKNGIDFVLFHLACPLHAMSLPSFCGHWLRGGGPKTLGA